MEVIQPDIGIIGAGIGGAAVAHYLSQLFPNATLDIFEANSQIGGRICDIDIAGVYYESGGSVILDKNKYMLGFKDKFGLKKRKTEKSGASFAVYRPEDSTLLYKPYPYIGRFLNTIRFIWACGIINFFKLFYHVKCVTQKLSKIYTLQEDGLQSYESIEDMLKALDLHHLTQISLRDYLSQQLSLSDAIVTNLVLPAIKGYYGQGLEVSAFIGMISLAAGLSGNLWAVHGGNSLIVENLINHVLQTNPRAQLYTSTSVKSVTRLIENEGQIYKLQTSPEMSHSKRYDILIIATPLHQDLEYSRKIKFENIQLNPYNTIPNRYHYLYVYHADGKYYKLNHEKFGSMNNQHFTRSLYCNAILTTVNLNSPKLIVGNYSKPIVNFNAIKYLRPINYGHDLKNSFAWKISTNAPLTMENLKRDLLDETYNKEQNITIPWDAIKITKWPAYPSYQDLHQNGSQKFPPVILNFDKVTGGGIYHIEAIEWAASAMEMSVIGAKNVALLAHSKWMKSLNHV